MNTQGKEIIDIDKPLEKDLNEIDLTVVTINRYFFNSESNFSWSCFYCF